MNNSIDIKIQILPHFDKEYGVPTYETTGAAGFDLKAQLGSGKSIDILPGQKMLVPTGLCFEVPYGYELQVRPRSGMAVKTNLMILNSPGTIDSDYRGELKILICNMGRKIETIEHGQRIAQGIVAPVLKVNFITSQSLSQTERGGAGFGSTGS